MQMQMQMKMQMQIIYSSISDGTRYNDLCFNCKMFIKFYTCKDYLLYI
jgi:hypothetical protein